jgi:RNA polymerase sigma-70 factor (ECF subfamily)
MTLSGAQSSSLTDVELVERCLRGDNAAWEQIHFRYRRRVLHVAYKFTGRYEEAEDLMQDVFLRIFRGLARFDREANFNTWLMSVARNHCIDHYRAKKRACEIHLEDVQDFHLTAAASGNPQRLVEEQDRRNLLRQALARLPEKLREAIILRDLMELTYEEMVARLGLPEGTVKSRLNRGRAALARQLRMSRPSIHRRRFHGGA